MVISVTWILSLWRRCFAWGYLRLRASHILITTFRILSCRVLGVRDRRIISRFIQIVFLMIESVEKELERIRQL